jgi:tetratricopeptide (TPR) repeat protein
LFLLGSGVESSSSMKRGRRRKFQEERAVQVAGVSRQREKSAEAPSWPGEQFRYPTVAGIALIVLSTVIIYAQTVRVPAIDYEDSYYLLHSPYVNVTAAFSRLGAAWSEPYFANFHPVTTTTWLMDRALADKSKPFDALPFRLTHLLYAVVGASLLIPLYRRLGLPAILAVLGALVYAVHPIRTEVVAWLSARKDLMALIFIALSFLAWLWARAAATPNQWRLRHALTLLLVLLAVLSKPIAVILPALFVAYEFCSEPHVGITRWRWAERHSYPLLTRTLALTAIFLAVGGVGAVIFRNLLPRDPLHGGWLIFVPIGLMPLLLAMAPPATELVAFREGGSAGARVLGPPFAILSVVFGAGSAWTFWAQEQVGAIKGGLTLLPTLNLTFDAMLAYAGKTLVPAYLRTSYAWSDYPYVSVKGLLGAALVCALVWTGMRLAGSPDRNRRLIAFGIFWYLIAFIPVSNLVPTSTKMADRYLFVPTVGAILGLLALAAAWFPASRRRQFAVCAALVLVVALYTVGAFRRTEVWCGKTTLWNGRPHPDLSLWTSAVETDPEDISALPSLALVYLRFNPPEAGRALALLNRALQLSEANQVKIAGGKQLDLSPLYQDLGDAYLAQASGLTPGEPGSDVWRQKKEAYASAVKYFEMVSQNPSGFAPSEARFFSRLADACEGQAQMDVQELAGATPEQRDSLVRERDKLRSKSEESIRRAREILVAGNVPSSDPEYRTVMIEQGNILFGREVGASNEEKAGYYRQALSRYQEAAALFPDDPRPFLYQGLCYERLTGMAQSPEEKRKQFALGEAALRKALTLQVASPDYSPALPYRGLASLYAHMNDFHSVLDSLKKAQQADPVSAELTHLNREIQGVEQYLAGQEKSR